MVSLAVKFPRTNRLLTPPPVDANVGTPKLVGVTSQVITGIPPDAGLNTYSIGLMISPLQMAAAFGFPDLKYISGAGMTSIVPVSMAGLHPMVSTV